MTTTICSRTLRSLVGAYLARPDVTAWLAAADLYEEAGDKASADWWRRRARWFPAILEPWKEILEPADSAFHGKRTTWATCRFWRVRFDRYYASRIVFVFVIDPDASFCGAGHWRRFDPAVTHGTQYATRRILALIDRYGPLWDASKPSTRRQHS